MASFINTPSVILAAPKQVRCFPKILTVIAYPNPSSFFIDTHSPWIAQSEGPVLGTRILYSQERIILRDGVRSVRVWVIHVNPQNPAVEITQVLAGHCAIGITRSIPTG